MSKTANRENSQCCPRRQTGKPVRGKAQDGAGVQVGVSDHTHRVVADARAPPERERPVGQRVGVHVGPDGHLGLYPIVTLEKKLLNMIGNLV